MIKEAVMVWFLKLMVFAQVLVDLHQIKVDAGYITWEIRPEPLMFSEDVEIQCTYHNNISCSDHIIWIWTIGNELIMINGTLSEKYKYGNKYLEHKSSCSTYSKLLISKFGENEYRETYKCSIANVNNTQSSFEEYSKTDISFENISYQYIPAKEMIITDLNIRNQQISFRLEFMKIYPVPECRLTSADTDISNPLEVQKTKTGLFYSVIFTTSISDMSMARVCDLCISCNGKWSQVEYFSLFCADRFLTHASDLTTDDTLIDKSSTKALTTEEILVDISSIKGYVLFLIIFVDVYGILYALIALVVMWLLFTTKDASERIMLSSRMSSIFYCLICSCSVISFIIFGGSSIKERPRIPVQLEYWMNIFTLIPMVATIIYTTAACVVTVITIKQLPKRRFWYNCRYICLTVCYQSTAVFLFIFIVWFWKSNDKVQQSRVYNDVLFVSSMHMNNLYIIAVFVVHCTMVKLLEKLHITKNKRQQRNTDENQYDQAEARSDHSSNSSVRTGENQANFGSYHSEDTSVSSGSDNIAYENQNEDDMESSV